MKSAALTSVQPSFEAGEKVFVAEGVFQGTLGHFVGLRPDTSWADVYEELRGVLRTHPVAWLRHCPEGKLDWTVLLDGRH